MDSNSGNPTVQLLREMTGRKNAVLAGRASAALTAALRARGIEGKQVLMPGNICYIVAWAVLQSGNSPLLVDVDPLTGNISPETLEKVKAGSPAALVICHMYGLGAPAAALADWASRRGIFVIEDATLALGATVGGRPAGAWGDISLFSFGEGKIVDAGNGGAFLCDDSELARMMQAELDTLPPWSNRLGRLRDEWTELYWLLHQYEAENPPLASVYPTLFRIYGELTAYKLPDLDSEVPIRFAQSLRASTQSSDPASLRSGSLFAKTSGQSFPAARLATGLSALRANLDHRLEMSALYDQYFRFVQVRTLLRPQGSVVWRYPLLVAADDRDALLKHLWDKDIHASRWYPSLTPMLAALAPAIERRSLPGTDQLEAEIINLPVDHTVDAEAVKRTAETVQAYFHEKRKSGTNGLR